MLAAKLKEKIMMKKYLLIAPFILSLSGCGTIDNMVGLLNESTEGINNNTCQVEQDTLAIKRNTIAIRQSTATIKQNRSLIEQASKE